MALNLSNVVADFLRNNPENKFTTRQIADWIFQTYPEECRQKQERSKASVIPLNTDGALIQQIAAEISSQQRLLLRKFPQIKIVEDRPKKLYYTSQTDIEEVKNAEIRNVEKQLVADQPVSLLEHSLYPKLAEYLFSEHGVYSKRINEKRSSNNRGSGGNKWLYPDLVGLEDLSRDWHSEIRECVKQYGDRKAKLWSFEVKLLVNRSNVREVFFQTVSNSSWANIAYLVAAQIEGGETIKELLMLTGLHGIGVIRLDVDNPAESEIQIPAKERSEVDWNTANRLLVENRDFQDYIELIRQFYLIGRTRQQDWDYK